MNNVQPIYDGNGNFQGFSLELQGDLTTPTDYKTLALAVMRVQEEQELAQ